MIMNGMLNELGLLFAREATGRWDFRLVEK
jgi:hypothetical protein